MTFTKLLLLTFVNVALGVLMKCYFFSGSFSANDFVLFWILTAVIAAACVRRLGVMNFFEMAFVGTIWIVVALLADLLITALFTGNQIFALWEYWGGFVVIALTIFAAHKKRHIHIRHEIHAAKLAKEHGHGGGHAH